MEQEIKDRIEKIKNGQVPEGYKNTGHCVIPKSWDDVLIDDVCERFTGHTPNKKVDEYWNGDIPWISLKDTNKLDNLYIEETVDYTTIEGINNSSAILLPKGTIVISRDATVGKIGIMKRSMATSQHFINYVCGRRINNLYLYYYLLSRKTDFQRIATGSTIVTIGMGYFKKLRIIEPPLPEQQKIATILSTCDKAIELKEKLIEEKKKQKKGLMQKLLTGEVRLPGFDGEWKEVKLGQVGRFFNGRNISKKDIETNGKNDCVLYGELFTLYSEVIDKVTSKTNKLEENNVIGKVNDLLFPTSTTVDALSLITPSSLKVDRVIVGGDIMIYRGDKNIINSDYLSYYFNSIGKRKLAKFAQGITIIHIYSNEVKDFKLNLPPIEDQEAIAEILSTADKEIELLKELLENKKEEKKGLMQLLLTGIVRVNTEN